MFDPDEVSDVERGGGTMVSVVELLILLLGPTERGLELVVDLVE